MSTSETETCLKANTSITLKCDWDGNFKLIDPKGVEHRYKRDKWNECSKKLWELVKPAQGDPK